MNKKTYFTKEEKQKRHEKLAFNQFKKRGIVIPAHK